VRRTLPLVESDGRIVWVAGIALSEAFKLTPATRRAARLRAVRATGAASRARE
jgi:hypothetical protein